MASCLCDYRHPTELKTYLDTLGTLSDGEVVCRVLSKTTLLVTKDGVCVWVPAHPSGDSPLFLALQSNQTDIPQSCFGAIALVQYTSCWFALRNSNDSGGKLFVAFWLSPRN